MKSSTTLFTKVNKGFILLWNDKRQDENEVKNIFNNQGNTFNFVKPNMTDTHMHIYFACDENNNIQCNFIAAKNDREKNFEWIYSSPLHKSKKSLPAPPTSKESSQDLDYYNAKKRVDHWINEDIRNLWINQQFNTDIKKNNIVQAFEIKVSDFIEDDTHTCYLGLKKNQEEKYQIDLIIFNTNTHKILNFNLIHKLDALHDLARPVPPFGDGLNMDDFGVLESLGII